MKKPERPVCGYCHTTVPLARHLHIGDTALCTDGNDISCCSKFLRLQKAKNEVLRILFLGRGVCDDAICAERVANATRLSTLRGLVRILINKIAQSIGEFRRRATKRADEILARLRRAADLVGLRPIPF